MKKIYASLIAGFLILNGYTQKVNPDFIDGQIYISLSKEYAEVMPKTIGSIDQKGEVSIYKFEFLLEFIEYYGITRVNKPYYNMTRSDNAMRLFKVYFNDIYNIDLFLKELSGIPEIRLAEKVPLPKMAYVPNDPHYNCTGGDLNWNWYLDVIDAEHAWDIGSGSLSTIVTVIDNAIHETHEDLENMIVAAYDATNSTEGSSSFTSYSEYSHNHGTHTSGLVSAETDNNTGIASIGNGTGLYTVKVGTQFLVVPNAINWAIGKDPLPKAFSLSFGWNDYVQSEADIYQDVHDIYDIVILAAAHNQGAEAYYYPAAYDGVVAVAATNEDDEKGSFSNYGDHIDVCAPGGFSNDGHSLLSCTAWSSTTQGNPAQYGITGNYNEMPGTSMATPVTAGLVGLMRSIAPSLTAVEIESCLFNSCDNIDDENPDYIGKIGHGRINAYQAVQCAQSMETGQPNANFYTEETTIVQGETIPFTDISYVGDFPVDTWSWTFEGGTPGTSTVTDPDITYYSPGTYQVSLTVTNSVGSDTETKEGYIKVLPMGSSFSLDFELPEDFAQIFPPWKNIDNDGEETVAGTDCEYPGQGLPSAFIAFNPAEAGFTAASPHSGERCGMAICPWYWAPYAGDPSDDWLISDKITIGVDAELKLWALNPRPEYGTEKYNILVSTTDDELSSFTKIATNEVAPETWTQMSYSLAAYQGMDIYVAIQNVTMWAYMLFIDDIEITGTITENNIMEKPEINIYPVPANDKIIITNAGNSTIEISDINGRVVLARSADSENVTLDLTSLDKGIYIVRVFNDKFIVTKKIILE